METQGMAVESQRRDVLLSNAHNFSMDVLRRFPIGTILEGRRGTSRAVVCTVIVVSIDVNGAVEFDTLGESLVDISKPGVIDTISWQERD